MFFEDGFKYSQEETNELVIWGVLNFIKKSFKNKNASKGVKISGSRLIRHLFDKFDIQNFDFINDETYMKIETAIRNSYDFLIINGLITSIISGGDKFKKYFIKKELYRSREFSNEYEVDIVMKMLYKLDMSFEYLVSPDFLHFYDVYAAYYIVTKSNKKVLITLPDKQEKMLLAVKKEVKLDLLEKAVENYDFSDMADYVAYYDIATDTVNLFNTSKSLQKTQEDRDLQKKILLVINIRPSLKQEFMFLKD